MCVSVSEGREGGSVCVCVCVCVSDLKDRVVIY